MHNVFDFESLNPLSEIQFSTLSTHNCFAFFTLHTVMFTTVPDTNVHTSRYLRFKEKLTPNANLAAPDHNSTTSKNKNEK